MVKGYSTMAQARVNSSRWLSGLAVGLVVSSYAYGGTSYVAPNGFVPDAATAIHVAEAILLPIYGEEKVLSERPFRASLGAGVWTIQGTLPAGRSAGGVALVKIAKRDARVIQVIHGK
jgi:hypothetical protein